METEMLKFLCANQGAADVEDLICNLFPGKSTNEVVSNPSKFALCSSDGRQRVVARTSLKLCRKKDCPGLCRGLHLCKNFLYSGCCQFLLRRGCSFPHSLDSGYNQMLLREHELDALSREELCMLLLQSDHSMLPAICHDYNNGDGVFGRCASGLNCERLHICERFLTQSCTCSRAHDFFAFQPIKILREKMVPDSIIQSLKSVYANRKALWVSSRGGASRGHRGNHSSSDGPNYGQRRGYRGRVRGGIRGHRGIRGSRGNRGHSMQQPPIYGDMLGDLYGYHPLTEDGFDDNDSLLGDINSSSSDISATGYDIDARSDSGLNLEQRQWYRGRGDNRGVRGTRGHRGSRGSGGNHPEQLRSTSLSDIWGEFEGLNPFSDSGPSRSASRQQDYDSSNSDISAITDDADKSGKGRRRKPRSRNRNKTSADKGRSNDQQGLQRASGGDDVSVAGREEGNGGDESSRRQRNIPAKDKTEICMYFIKGYCKHEDKCFKAHDKMPYRWQVREGDQWNALPDNETIEKEYCDPCNTYSSGSPAVHFDTMTRGESKVRRLSTINSLVEPSFIHTTVWLWYWQDEFGKWNQYGSDGARKKSADINSATLEQKFLDNENDVVEFSAGSQSYSLSFQDMIQTNKQYGTKRLVSRRPQFVSAAEVRTKKVRRPPANSPSVPDNWDKTQIPPTGFSRVALPRTSDEFQRLETLFCTTQRGFDIIKIERIQNKALWEVFQWQKNQMKNNNGGREVEEKQLFHGTNSKYVDAICLNNFDWRICGVNGTAYGKGSYFARDAKYSHSYTGDSDVKTMFINRVLVGSYTKGESSYVRPPSKDGGDINFYDSCVNDVTTPSIFVVFEKHQIYPEYLLQYKTKQLLVSRTSVSVQQPNPVPAPKQPVYQPSSSSYQPSTLSYQPSTLSYQPSSSSNQPSTASYRSSSSSYQPSTLSYQPSSSYQPSTTSSPYQTRPAYQSSLSFAPSSPKPPPKKSDSCVIA
ncbi:protein mono-ADP-ribosyltransferase PARP12 isoform 2-T2 [Fundulus diaphanus]